MATPTPTPPPPPEPTPTPEPTPEPTPQAAPPPPDDPVVATYQGQPAGTPGHEFISGIPATDLTASQYAALTTEQRLQLMNTPQSGGQPLYQMVPAPEARTAEAAAPPATEPVPPPPPPPPVPYPAADPATTPVLPQTPDAAPAPPKK